MGSLLKTDASGHSEAALGARTLIPSGSKMQERRRTRPEQSPPLLSTKNASIKYLEDRPDTLRDILSKGFEKLGFDSRMAAELGGRATNLADVTPIIGDAIAAKGFVKDLSEGDVKGMAVNAMAALPFVPGLRVLEGGKKSARSFEEAVEIQKKKQVARKRGKITRPDPDRHPRNLPTTVDYAFKNVLESARESKTPLALLEFMPKEAGSLTDELFRTIKKLGLSETQVRNMPIDELVDMVMKARR